MGPGRELKRNLTGIPEPNQGPEPESERALTPTAASRFAQITLACVWREYPNKMDHILHGPEDVRSPKQLHPSFYGCFDWHSAVHGHWMLAKLLRTFPDLPAAVPGRAGCPPRPGTAAGRGGLFPPPGPLRLRTHLRLGLAAQTGG